MQELKELQGALQKLLYAPKGDHSSAAAARE